MSPRTSVIMPAFNTAGTIERAIKSVTGQTDPDFELLIVNDASPDDLKLVVAQYLGDHPDPRIRYLENQQHLGLAETRNRGLREAEGQWIAFLDSDDQYTPTFLETMHNAVTPTSDVIVCAHCLHHESGETTYRRRGEPGTCTGHDAMLQVLRDEMTPYAWDKIYRASRIRGVTFPPIGNIKDEAFTVPAFKRARRVKVLRDALHWYSVDESPVTSSACPPLEDCWRHVEHLKMTTNAHLGTETEKNALAVAWVLCFLNAAQTALRLQPENLRGYVKGCREALRLPLVLRTLKTAPFFGAAGLLLRLSPSAYRTLYGSYVQRSRRA
ncbi:glycosyltransferase family 2 protein [Rothia koreensis]|uniref:glycosyltransferase family 2 protein n=1 Tax=Rothia koreensis TaxID=592378 RepID=UPI003FCC4BD2